MDFTKEEIDEAERLLGKHAPGFWLPISTAPREVYRSDPVDLWVIPDDGYEGRVTGCYIDDNGLWSNKVTMKLAADYAAIGNKESHAVVGDVIVGQITHWMLPSVPLDVYRKEAERNPDDMDELDREGFRDYTEALTRAQEIIEAYGRRLIERDASHEPDQMREFLEEVRDKPPLAIGDVVIQAPLPPPAPIEPKPKPSAPPRRVRCTTCGGSGKVQRGGAFGSIPVYSQLFKPAPEQCSRCHGAGTI